MALAVCDLISRFQTSLSLGLSLLYEKASRIFVLKQCVENVDYVVYAETSNNANHLQVGSLNPAIVIARFRTHGAGESLDE